MVETRQPRRCQSTILYVALILFVTIFSDSNCSRWICYGQELPPKEYALESSSTNEHTYHGQEDEPIHHNSPPSSIESEEYRQDDPSQGSADSTLQEHENTEETSVSPEQPREDVSKKDKHENLVEDPQSEDTEQSHNQQYQPENVEGDHTHEPNSPDEDSTPLPEDSVINESEDDDHPPDHHQQESFHEENAHVDAEEKAQASDEETEESQEPPPQENHDSSSVPERENKEESDFMNLDKEEKTDTESTNVVMEDETSSSHTQPVTADTSEAETGSEAEDQAEQTSTEEDNEEEGETEETLEEKATEVDNPPEEKKTKKEGSLAQFFEKVKEKEGKRGGPSLTEALAGGRPSQAPPKKSKEPEMDIEQLEELSKKKAYSGIWGSLTVNKKRYADLHILSLLFDESLADDASKRYGRVFEPIDLVIPKVLNPDGTLKRTVTASAGATGDGSTSTSAGNASQSAQGRNQNPNEVFVEDLDDFTKFFKDVEPPDELDVGAAGTSLQDVLMGSTTKIILKRTKMAFQFVVNGFKAAKVRVTEYLADEDKQLPKLDKEKVAGAGKWIVEQGKHLYEKGQELYESFFEGDELEGVEDLTDNLEKIKKMTETSTAG